MKKVLILILLLFVCPTIVAQGVAGSIASIPFTGEGFSEGDREVYANMFAREFSRLGYQLVTRTSGNSAIFAELNYQRTGSTAEMGKIGKQLKADMVMYGGLVAMSDGRYSISVQIINTETGRIIAADSKILPSIYDMNDSLVKDMSLTLNSNITGRAYRSTYLTGAQQASRQQSSIRQDTIQMQNDYDTANIVKWVGRGGWILGATLMIIPVFIEVSWDIPGYTGFAFLTAEPAQEIFVQGSGLGTADYIPSYYTTEGGTDESSLSLMRGVFWTGAVLLVAGITTDVIFSVKGSRLKQDLESRGIYVHFNPYIAPTLGGGLDYGATFGVAYKF